MDTFTAIRTTTTNWTTEEGEKVIESVEHVDSLIPYAEAQDLLLTTGRQWLTPWRSVEWSYTPVEEN